MLGSCNVVAFVATRDTARARQFYGETLGLTFVREDQFAVVFDSNGILIRITPIPNHQPLPHTVLGWQVPDVGEAVRKLNQAGVLFERYSFLEQDDLGIWTAPGGAARVAWFQDPDGNLLSLSGS